MTSSGWIPKRDAIALVAAVHDSVSRASARSTLGKWVRDGRVRTKDGERPAWAKRPRQLYRRADITQCIADRPRATWTAAEDSLLGTDLDRVIAGRLGRTVAQMWWRRRKLGIASHGPSAGARCDPGSWRRPHGDQRLRPPNSPMG